MSDIGYPIKIEFLGFRDIANHFNTARYSKIVQCVDPEVFKNHQELFSNTTESVFVLPQSGESAKAFDITFSLCEFFKKSNLDRHSLVIAVGGGAIGDAVGFAASIYMRGISVLHVPTTLLSMVDSSVGAKTAINFSGVKNLVGTFHPPMGVLIDVDFLRTLPTKEFNSGAAEIIKHGIIADREYFELVARKACRVLDNDELASVIRRSVEIKSSVVLKDPKEIGERKILNFGHTIGHCIEASLGILHGEAIAIGMVLESKIASFVLPKAENLTELIIKALEKNELPTSLEKLDRAIPWNDFHSLLLLDKKNKDGTVLLALPQKLGSCMFDIPVSFELIRSVVEGE